MDVISRCALWSKAAQAEAPLADGCRLHWLVPSLSRTAYDTNHDDQGDCMNRCCLSVSTM